MEAMHKLVDYMQAMKYEDLPPEVVELINLDFMDYIGCSFAGTGDPCFNSVVELYSEWGGKPECSVFTKNIKLPSITAAQLNATLGFAVDMDDIHYPAGHVAVTVFPAALAIAERDGNISGKDFITAIAGSMELFCRLGVYNQYRVPRHIFGGWEYHALHAAFSSAAATAMLLKLDRTEFLNAMGIAYMQCSGTGKAALEYADTKTLGPGFGIRNGMTSVLMAQRGITGAHNILEGDYGLGNMFHGGLDAAGIVSGLGEKFEMLDIGFKRFASCRLGQRTLDALYRIMKEHSIKADDVERVEILASERVLEQLYFPTEKTKNPTRRNEAVFSLPWAAASLIVRGKVSPAELNPEGLADPDIHAMAQKIHAEIDHTIDPGDHGAILPITIVTRFGKYTAYTMKQAPGDVGNRYPLEEHLAKFYDCMSQSIDQIPMERQKKIVELSANLENIENMMEVVDLLV